VELLTAGFWVAGHTMQRKKVVDDDEQSEQEDAVKLENAFDEKLEEAAEENVEKDLAGESRVKTEDGEEADENEEHAAEEDPTRLETSFEFMGDTYTYKERAGAVEEREGRIEFRVVHNNGSKESFLILTGLKNIFQKQLPKMPREYISRLVYDKNHVSIAVIKKPMTVVGGIAYRPFESHKFAEIVFCAISSSEQVRGYGAHMMNHFKDYVKNTSQIMHFLTYADNYAIGYFKKQGFTKTISLPKEQWMGYIKDYEGGTLMQCTMVPKIRYLDGPKIMLLHNAAINEQVHKRQRQFAVAKQVRRPGLQIFKDKEKDGTLKDFKGMDPLEIPGIKETGWTAVLDALARKPKRRGEFGVMQQILGELQGHPSAWPFMAPVSKEDVPDYYDLIAEPMDLGTMEQKLEKDQYDSFESFLYDAHLIFDNCRKYNSDTTTYYKNATKLEKFFHQKVKEHQEYEHLVD